MTQQPQDDRRPTAGDGPVGGPTQAGPPQTGGATAVPRPAGDRGPTSEPEQLTTAERRRGFLGVHDPRTPDEEQATGRDAPVRPSGASAAGQPPHGPAGAAGYDRPTEHLPVGDRTPAAGAAAGTTSGWRDAPGPAARREAPDPAPRRDAPGPEARRDAPGPEARRDAPGPAADVALAGATQARPRSRAAAHLWAAVVTLVLAPIAWYLVADGGARLFLADGAPWDTGTRNLAAIAELACGLVLTAVVLLAARWSSVGALVVGALVLLAGIAVVAFPAEAREVLEQVADRLRGLGQLGTNAAQHLLADAGSARLALYGLALLCTGIVSHGARRQGRTEERRRSAYERSRRATGPDAP
ncbi:hypothetical protein MF406_02880 [Georgenia sp. TF02-10]|uniref:hypothetical protein n=1 Tax=Georgenia sp. TF02-10 TaxID=2917725 RepID=UPI001FA6F6F1|nr:hypothetical protein [Georgenia sp. TF02-10]UNX55241.1 hypothetical protein MF406_02880 [Georgenia sp. TF02-10]